MTESGNSERSKAIELAMRKIEEQFGKGRIIPLQTKRHRIGVLTKVNVLNYKSIRNGSISLTDLTVFVGMNGSGKSNMLDAITFLSDVVLHGLDFAINSRGGMQSIVRNTQRLGSFFSIKLFFVLDDGIKYSYKLKIKRPRYGEYQIAEEVLTANSKVKFRATNGNVDLFQGGVVPKNIGNNLLLAVPASSDTYVKVKRFISGIRLYSPNVDAIRSLALPNSNRLLSKGAENIAGVVGALDSGQGKIRVTRYLSKINPVIRSFVRRKFGKMQAVNFTTSNNRYYLYPDSMSDGTLRAFALLIAMFQDDSSDTPELSLICIEEPETGLHPAAASIMMDAIMETSKDRQIVITTHSADILEDVNVDKTNIVFTTLAKDGSTVFSNISSETKEIIRKGLYHPGELLRMGQLL